MAGAAEGKVVANLFAPAGDWDVPAGFAKNGDTLPLAYKTPDQVYLTAQGGGACIVNKFVTTEAKNAAGMTKTGQRRPAAVERVPSYAARQGAMRSERVE
ncbi:hypothetical protein RP726_05405 [Candidatus Methylospira mobilis]|uniref:hypothetical protein n=1 Tax=Candidatus Methylospira mobilis TaxID=1808979 RepID=UPI0028E6E95E|nr:hypothetical protein [Candidatus Methylospira mobilis]WNV05848.1 hypothetical protein RP726_05405 [Candidatus Methylospira mobilis]